MRDRIGFNGNGCIFDAYLMVDWSAASKPNTGKDSIWLAWLGATSGRIKTWNPPTRLGAEEIVRRLLETALAEDKRVLVGFDFPYGYPQGAAQRLELGGANARKALWNHLASEIQDSANNHNNRFDVAAELNRRSDMIEGPFWGCPANQARQELSTKKPKNWLDSGLSEYRVTERRTKGAQPVWKLFYNGSVGGQTLMGIPRLNALVEHRNLVDYSVVWPFDTGMKSPLDWGSEWRICHAEIYPSLIDLRPEPGQVKDEAQVIQLAQYFRELDFENRLSDLFCRPSNIDESTFSGIIAEEGWILGVQ